MKIADQMVDAVILRELGERLARVRLERNLKQAELATQAGVAKRTLERMEAGGATQLVNLVRVCRALGLVERFDTLIPQPAISPVAQLKLQGRQRKRAASARAPAPAGQGEKGEKGKKAKWQWGDKR